MNRIIILAMHGVPPNDFPKKELGEFFSLHMKKEVSGFLPLELQEKHDELDKRLRIWERTEKNDPYFVSSMRLASELKKITNCEVIVGFNEFCGPSVIDALENAINENAEKIQVITPMMTPGGEHSEKDIPEAIELIRKKYPKVKIEYVWPFSITDVAEFLAEQL